MYSKQAIEITKKNAYCPGFVQFFSQNSGMYLCGFIWSRQYFPGV